MQPFSLLLSVATGIRTMMYCKNDGLRDYQQEMKLRLFKEWEFHRSVMVQMPTGTGKTHLLAAVVKEFLCGIGTGTRVWIVAHRRELVEQIEETAARYGMGKEPDKTGKNGKTGKDSMPEESGRVRVFSIQWLSRNWKNIGEAPGLIVIDEAHHALAETYRELWKRYPEARKLGMTATPCRLNGKGFTDLFDALITSWSIAEFIGKGWLSAFDYVSIRADSREQQIIDSLKKRGVDGDYQVKEMNEVLNRQVSIRRLYESVERYAAGKKGMVYAVSIAHARQIAACYNAHGVSAVAIDSKTPASERRELVEGFRQGRIRVLVNVDIFSEGFDCPDVEFVQLARPTLSLAKYLQQVGRGLRRSADKASCMLIDNVGLYRIFGLPTQRWNWDAMFRGRMAGKGSLPGRMNCDASVTAFPVVERPAEAGGDLVVVMEHGRLLSSIREQALPDEKEQSPSCRLRAFVDKETGLWGLEKGDEMLPDASFKEVLSIKGRFAVGRLRNGCVRVLDDTGALVAEPGHCREVRFLKDDLLQVRHAGNSVSYVDLRNGRCYSVRPRVLRYGSIELLQANRTYYSRTRQVYANTCGLPSSSIVWMGFYVKMYDGRVPSRCRRMEEGGFCCEPQVCLLEGDEERAYYLSGRLPDQSIVVMDEKGRYYHVEKGHGKRYVACNRPSDRSEDFDEAVALLRRQADERVEKRLREEKCEYERKRQRIISRSVEAVPFQIGVKWGLRTAERILIPPVYRRILHPVGGYCAYQDSSCQWGVLAVDGRIIIRARYMEVEIDRDGTARLTLVPGKMETVKLTD